METKIVVVAFVSGVDVLLLLVTMMDTQKLLIKNNHPGYTFYYDSKTLQLPF